MPWLNAGTPSNSNCLSTHTERPNESATPAMVTQCAPTRPIARPASPARMDASSGARTMVSSVDCESMKCAVVRSWVCVEWRSGALAFHLIQLFDVDAAAFAEQHHQDRKSDGRLGRRHRHDEDH